ncbi:MAG TPA: lmo0937 family membrane protein [Chloroflexia bacterium]
MASILWTIAVILIVLWLLGFLLNVAGLAASGIIHILLVIAVIVIVYNLITGRRAV